MRAGRKGRRETKTLPGEADATRHYIRSLKLTDFRNYARAELALEARPVVLIGDNGSGKTNLLEAVSLLGPGHGLRGRPYGELCRKEGAGGFAVAATVVSSADEIDIGTGILSGTREETSGRAVRIAGKEESAGALAEYVKLVWLIPAMDGLFTGAASERRRFLDRLVLAVDPKMRSPLSRYDRAMRQRNRLFQLKEGSRTLFEGLEE
jgi:DNA replication and repair protein RecF